MLFFLSLAATSQVQASNRNANKQEICICHNAFAPFSWWQFALRHILQVKLSLSPLSLKTFAWFFAPIDSLRCVSCLAIRTWIIKLYKFNKVDLVRFIFKTFGSTSTFFTTKIFCDTGKINDMFLQWGDLEKLNPSEIMPKPTTCCLQPFSLIAFQCYCYACFRFMFFRASIDLNFWLASHWTTWFCLYFQGLRFKFCIPLLFYNTSEKFLWQKPDKLQPF